MTPRLDIVVPYCDSPERRPALGLVMQALATQAGAHRANIILSVCSGAWMPSHTRNQGALRGSAPWILFLDADMALEPEGLTRILKLTDSSDMDFYVLTGWRNTPETHNVQKQHDWESLEAEGQLRYLHEPYSSAWYGAVAQRTKGMALYDRGRYGPYLVTREAFTRLGGFDEAFQGWGGEDDAFITAAGRLGLRMQQAPNPAFIHLPHPRCEGSKSNADLIRRNYADANDWRVPEAP